LQRKRGRRSPEEVGLSQKKKSGSEEVLSSVRWERNIESSLFRRERKKGCRPERKGRRERKNFTTRLIIRMANGRSRKKGGGLFAIGRILEKGISSSIRRPRTKGIKGGKKKRRETFSSIRRQLPGPEEKKKGIRKAGHWSIKGKGKRRLP